MNDAKTPWELRTHAAELNRRAAGIRLAANHCDEYNRYCSEMRIAVDLDRRAAELRRNADAIEAAITGKEPANALR